MDLTKAKDWLNMHPPQERIVDHKVMQSYRHEYPIIRDLIAEVERLTAALATERERCAAVAYDRLMTMGYELRAGDVRDAILAEAVPS